MMRGIFFVLTFFATPSIGQDSAYVVTLANGIKRLRAVEDSCKSYLAADTVLHNKFNETISDQRTIIGGLYRNIADYKTIITRDSLQFIEKDNIIESYKPSWFEKYIFRREVIFITGCIVGYFIGRQ